MSDDRLPPGGQFYRPGSKEGERHHCSTCDHVWYVPMFWELGSWFYYDEDDAICPNCKEGMIDADCDE